ncbi:protein arginine N-methyltransferase 9 isoform X1 [Hemiscyllium ocellatum]|uniref:protein arginine N-methyltransferase 9 isoform X1 n=3 Tax=Hemiscyllium ocellatum TaxID=170820 RepID=UPI002966ABE6|nr:protein arginine N-methyltransferase 9 isoform X1 [Hemiscyllium ocellatum]
MSAPRPGRRGRVRLVYRSLQSAQDYLDREDFGTAFAHYLLLLNVAPELKDIIRESFQHTLFKWAEELNSLSRIQDIFDCYEQALELYPNNEVIWNSMGEHLFSLGFRDEAAGYFHKSIKLNPDYAEARENFYRVANWLVERWHFLMLNDKKRNVAYQRAIQKTVQSGCMSVLDIGTGTGILSMFARKAGASHVYACELSKTMYELACEVIASNQMAGQIQVLHMKSLDMEVPKDLPSRVSLVVTETVDAGLFGEGIVESLIHAWQHLLLPPKPTSQEGPSEGFGRVIPLRAVVFGMAVDCQEIRRHHRVCLNEAGGLHLNETITWYSPVSNESCVDDTSEPYTTERMRQVPGGYTPLTDHFQALTIDFNNPQELEELSTRKPCRLCLPVVKEGVLDAIVAWFVLQLDEDISLSTGPDEETCWEQAVYPVQGGLGQFVKPGNTLIVDVSCNNAYLVFHTVAILSHELRMEIEVNTMSGQNSSLASEAELCDALANLQTTSKSKTNLLKCMLESSEIARLNNTQYNERFKSALDNILSSLTSMDDGVCFSQTIDDRSADMNCENSNGQSSSDLTSDILCVLDVSEGFSILPLVAAKLRTVKVFSSLEKVQQQAALCALAESNDISKDLLEFWHNYLEDDSTLLQRPQSGKLWSVIILDAIEVCGLIRQGLVEKATLARCLLRPEGRLLPQCIKIYGMLIESETLQRESAVQGKEATLGFNIAPFINQFKVPVHVFLHLSTLPHIRLSEPVELLKLDLMSLITDELCSEIRVQVHSSGRVTAVPFWYEIYLDTDVSLNTWNDTSHWKQAAFVLDNPIQVISGDELRLKIQYHKSSISMIVNHG